MLSKLRLTSRSTIYLPTLRDRYLTAGGQQDIAHTAGQSGTDTCRSLDTSYIDTHRYSYETTVSKACFIVLFS